MQFILWGMLFVFLDFNVEIGTGTVGLIPDFLGYILLTKGLFDMKYENHRFARTRIWAIATTVFAVLLYGIDLMGAALQTPYVYLSLILTVLIAQLYIGYQVVMGIVEMEADRHWDLQGGRLKTIWTYVAALSVLVYALAWVPLVGSVCAIAAFILGIIFLVALHKTARLYREHTEES